MADNLIMACGCAASGILTFPDGRTGRGCCIHSCLDVAQAQPDLTGRMAKCAYSDCKTPPRPSDPAKLAFFVYMGPGSLEAVDICKCGYAKIAHDEPERRKNIKCRQFTPKGPREFDKFYCGCKGWD